MPEPRPELVDDIRQRLEANDLEGVRVWVRGMHPADIADLLEELEEPERLAVMALLDDATAGEVLDETADDVSTEVIENLDDERAADILEEMRADDAAEILTEIPEDQAQELIQRMEREPAAEVRELLDYPEDSAGRLMSREFVAVEQDLTAQQAIERLRELHPSAEMVYYVYVVDAAGRLTGVLSLRDLITSRPERPVADIMLREVQSVEAATDQEEAANAIAKYDLLAVPVVDEGRLVGILTVDDAIDVITDEATEDIQKMGGIGAGDEVIETPAWRALRKRLPWMLLILGLYLLVPAGIAPFQVVIAQVALLAVFMPVISAIGGNVGSQALAVTIRALAASERPSLWLFLRVAKKELLLGLVQGVALGGALALIGWLWTRNGFLAAAIGVGLGVNVLVACLLGGIIPVVLRRMGRDPAMLTGPVMTLVMDFFGFVIFLSIAARLLHLLA